MSEKKYTGLSDIQVQESRNLHGWNILTPAAKTPWWKLLLEKFRDPMIIILLVAGLLSICISIYEYEWLDDGLTVFFEPCGIFVAVILATGLGFWFEQRANKEFDILNRVNDDEPVQVFRNGMATRVPKKEIVVGDVIVLNTGDEIPADATLLEADSLTIDESTLTGEPMTHKTTIEADFDLEATFPSNMVLRGTRVMEGHAVAEVTAVGDATENGKVFTASQIDDNTKTPLSEQLDRLGHMIAYIGYGVGAVVVIGRLLVYFTSIGDAFTWVGFIAYLLQTIMVAVTLLVVSVPEGLPMAVTLSLAYSMRRMLKTNNLVRKLHACETMGSTTVICTDKTGTLTQNQMNIAEVSFFGFEGGNPDMTDAGQLVIDSIALNTTATLDLTDPEHATVLGNPTEGALLLWLRSKGYDADAIRNQYTVVESLPFSTERKFMACVVVHKANGSRHLFVKGAPEIVFGLCSSVAGTDELTQAKQAIDTCLLTWQQKGMRTLGFAIASLADDTPVIIDKKLAQVPLQFAGIVAISDPVRSDVPDAIARVFGAGIKVKIVTGDTPATAREIGHQIGLITDTDTDKAVITGPEFGALTDEQLLSRLPDLKIIARARPMDKKRLVESLQSMNEVVAVTGDGTNDAPALKAAHVGLSMGDGTSVAKEASDITIIDNSFASIGRAVMWGRSLYRNIQRFIMFQSIVNVVASLTVLCGAFMGTQSPLTVTQMLWVNLIMDTFAAMALASLPPTESVMSDKPRNRSAFIITPDMWRQILSVGLTFFAALIAMVYIFQHTDIDCLSDLLHIKLGAKNPLSPYELTIFFTTFVMLQFWNLFNVRAFATHQSALHLKNCSEFLLIIAVILVGQIVIVNFGGVFFNVTPICLSDWLWITGATSLVLWIGELMRAVNRSLRRN